MAKLHFRYGTMGSAKTAMALMHQFNFEEKNNRALLAKPATDTRTNEVWSRIGIKESAITLEQLCKMEFYELSLYKVIIIDEAQFCEPKQVEFLSKIADTIDIPVFAYGLKTDYTSKLFEGSKRLLELADEIEEVKTSCWCGHSAKFNARIVEGKIARKPKDGSTIDIEVTSGTPKYTALCRKHYMSGEHGMHKPLKKEPKI